MNLNVEARINDVQAVVLESDSLRASVLPTVGAKVYDFVSMPRSPGGTMRSIWRRDGTRSRISAQGRGFCWGSPGQNVPISGWG